MSMTGSATARPNASGANLRDQDFGSGLEWLTLGAPRAPMKAFCIVRDV
jgi:hypothetical protein